MNAWGNMHYEEIQKIHTSNNCCYSYSFLLLHLFHKYVRNKAASLKRAEVREIAYIVT
jgi:hypothetical protein